MRFATPAAPVCSWPSAILEPERVQGLSPDYGAVIDKVENGNVERGQRS